MKRKNNSLLHILPLVSAKQHVSRDSEIIYAKYFSFCWRVFNCDVKLTTHPRYLTLLLRKKKKVPQTTHNSERFSKESKYSFEAFLQVPDYLARINTTIKIPSTQHTCSDKIIIQLVAYTSVNYSHSSFLQCFGKMT